MLNIYSENIAKKINTSAQINFETLNILPLSIICHFVQTHTHTCYYRHISFSCALLYWIDQYCIFSLQIKVLWQLYIEQIYWYHCPTACAHSVSLCNILVILTIFKTFSLLSYLPWWAVISDLWCYYSNCFWDVTNSVYRRWQT